jgi:transcriptional regulator with XRE-family HTH domain
LSWNEATLYAAETRRGINSLASNLLLKRLVDRAIRFPVLSSGLCLNDDVRIGQNFAMNLVELAQRIRTLRLDQRLTLEEVAARTGQTRSWLSKVENFRVTPSLPALAEIAGALGISTSKLLEGLDEKPVLVLVKHNERKIVDRNQSPQNTSVYESLAYKRASRSMDPFLITIPPGVAREEALPHPGEEFLFVQSGTVDLEYDNVVHKLATGDSLYFDATVPHRLMNPYKQPAVVLCVFQSPLE